MISNFIFELDYLSQICFQKLILNYSIKNHLFNLKFHDNFLIILLKFHHYYQIHFQIFHKKILH